MGKRPDLNFIWEHREELINSKRKEVSERYGVSPTQVSYLKRAAKRLMWIKEKDPALFKLIIRGKIKAYRVVVKSSEINEQTIEGLWQIYRGEKKAAEVEHAGSEICTSLQKGGYGRSIKQRDVRLVQKWFEMTCCPGTDPIGCPSAYQIANILRVPM